MDTDSYTCDIRSPDFYGDLKGMVEHFDTLEYLEELRKRHDLPNVSKKVLDRMKDENGGSILTEFVELRFKMYAPQTEDKETKAAKKKVVEHGISFDFYKTCLRRG